MGAAALQELDLYCAHRGLICIVVLSVMEPLFMQGSGHKEYLSWLKVGKDLMFLLQHKASKLKFPLRVLTEAQLCQQG